MRLVLVISHRLSLECLLDKEYSLNAVLYRLSLEDEIAFDTSAPRPIGGPFAGANVNFDPTTHQGLILSGHYRVSTDLGLASSFTYTDAEFDSGVYKGNSISGVPDRLFSIASDYKYNDLMKVYIEAAYTSDRYLSGDNDNLLNKQSAYSVVNANIEYKVKNLLISARINNLFNREYIESANNWGALYPSPERNFWLTMAYKFK